MKKDATKSLELRQDRIWRPLSPANLTPCVDRELIVRRTSGDAIRSFNELHQLSLMQLVQTLLFFASVHKSLILLTLFRSLDRQS
jgi:hypothetical protein